MSCPNCAIHRSSICVGFTNVFFQGGNQDGGEAFTLLPIADDIVVLHR